KKLGANPYMGGIIGAALLEPQFASLVETADKTDFFGIPVLLMDYSSSLVPSFVAVLAYAQLEKFLKRHIYQDLQLFLVPMLSLMIIVPLTVIAFGPFGIYVGEMIADVINFLSDKSGILTGALVGGLMLFLIMFGLHWALIPMSIENLMNGGDPIDPMWAASTFAQMGIALGIFLKTKDKSLKSLAGSTSLTGFLSGVTEPIIYGLILRYKRTIPYVVIAGAIGGAFIGAFKGEANAFVLHSLFTLSGSMTPWFPYLITIIISVGVAAALTYFVGFENKEDETQKEVEIKETNDTKLVKQEKVMSPLTGNAIALSEVEDQVFASEAMGKGMAVQPTEGKVRAPFNGTVSALFPTKHAIGLTSKNGTEILIHVGLNTVQLDGQHFTAHVQPGDSIAQGDLLLTFDIKAIETAGYSCTTPVIVTNSADFMDIVTTSPQPIEAGQQLLTAVK
ncbi:MAG: glucose PTS transporter subunit IIA, partial [Bacilli bacterium]